MARSAASSIIEPTSRASDSIGTRRIRHSPPSLGLTSISASGDHLTTYDASIGVLLHGRGSRVGAGLYLRPFAGLTGVSESGASSRTQTHVGAGLGLAIPFAERMATRLELSYEHGFASTYSDGVNVLNATIGLSFFNH